MCWLIHTLNQYNVILLQSTQARILWNRKNMSTVCVGITWGHLLPVFRKKKKLIVLVKCCTSLLFLQSLGKLRRWWQVTSFLFHSLRMSPTWRAHWLGNSGATFFGNARKPITRLNTKAKKPFGNNYQYIFNLMIFSGAVYPFLILHLQCLISYNFDQLLCLFTGLYQLRLQLFQLLLHDRHLSINSNQQLEFWFLFKLTCQCKVN